MCIRDSIETVNFSLKELPTDLMLITESPSTPNKNKTIEIITMTDKYDESNLFF